MLIDWFTVSAQIINFLILMWLLKRYLYKPILKAIAAREALISGQLADASIREAKAKEEQEDFQKKNEAFEQQKAELMDTAKKQAEEARQKLLQAAGAEADALRAKNQEALKNDEQNMNQDILRRTKREVFAIAAKALRDLADASLEERMVGAFLKQLHNLTDEDKQTLSSAAPPALITSALALPQAQRDILKAAMRESLGIHTDSLRFATAPELVSGIELSVGGNKLDWSIAEYLATLEKNVDEQLESARAA